MIIVALAMICVALAITCVALAIMCVALAVTFVVLAMRKVALAITVTTEVIPAPENMTRKLAYLGQFSMRKAQQPPGAIFPP